MKAAVGDRIVIASSMLDQPARDGEIVEVRGADGSPPYVVEWSDNGHRGLIFPGPDAHVQHFGPDGQPIAPPAEPVTRSRTWRVELSIVEKGGRTTAHATLIGDVAPVEADGRAMCNPTDLNVPEIGDEVAAARALRQLADNLLATAADDIAELEGAPVVLQPR